MKKIKVYSRDPHVTGCAYLDLYDPRILNGYWYSKENDQPIKAAYLGQTVIFRIETEDIKPQSTLTLRLYDLNKDQFDGDVYQTLVHSDKATVELELSPSWLYRLIKKQRSLKLYWEVTYQQDNTSTKNTKKLPLSQKDYLTVMPRLLYVAPSKAGSQLPDMYTRTGDRFSINEAVGAVKGVLNDPISDAIDKSYQYLLVRLDAAKVNADKFDKVAGSKIVGALKYHGEILDVVDVIRSGGKSVSSLPIPITGPLAPLTIVANILVNDFDRELKSAEREIELRMMEAAKQKGLIHVRDFVKRNDPGHEKYALINIFPDIVINILHGKYYLIKDIERDINNDKNKDIVMFCRIITMMNENAYIIESFYWDGV